MLSGVASATSGGGEGIFCLRLGLFYLRLVFVAYAKLAWSSLLTVQISVWSFLNLRLKVVLVFFAYGGNLVLCFLLTVPPVRKSGLVCSACGSPIVRKKTDRKQKRDLNCK